MDDVAGRADVLLFSICLQLVSQFLDIVNKKDAFTLARLTGLYDHHGSHAIFVLDLSNVTFQFGHLMGYDPGLWVKAEIDWVLILHLLEASRKVGFLRHTAHRREVVHFLEGLELTELF